MDSRWSKWVWGPDTYRIFSVNNNYMGEKGEPKSEPEVEEEKKPKIEPNQFLRGSTRDEFLGKMDARRNKARMEKTTPRLPGLVIRLLAAERQGGKAVKKYSRKVCPRRFS